MLQYLSKKVKFKPDEDKQLSKNDSASQKIDNKNLSIEIHMVYGVIGQLLIKIMVLKLVTLKL